MAEEYQRLRDETLDRELEQWAEIVSATANGIWHRSSLLSANVDPAIDEGPEETLP